MNKTTAAIIVVAIVVIGLFFGLIYLVSIGGLDHYFPVSNGEGLIVSSVFTNGTENAVFIEVTSQSKDITIDGVVIKNSTGTTVSNSQTADLVLEGETRTLRVNFNATTAGAYTVTLVTTKGNSFVSPPFTIPED